MRDKTISYTNLAFALLIFLSSISISSFNTCCCSNNFLAKIITNSNPICCGEADIDKSSCCETTNESSCCSIDFDSNCCPVEIPDDNEQDTKIVNYHFNSFSSLKFKLYFVETTNILISNNVIENRKISNHWNYQYKTPSISKLQTFIL